MPSRPPRLCACGHLVPAGERCACQVKRAAAARARHDASRPSATARGYDADWRALRARFLAAHPRCAVCDAPAAEVDHVETVAERPDLRLAWSNLRAMCRPCHSRRTAREQGFARPRTPTPSDT